MDDAAAVTARMSARAMVKWARRAYEPLRGRFCSEPSSLATYSNIARRADTVPFAPASNARAPLALEHDHIALKLGL